MSKRNNYLTLLIIFTLITGCGDAPLNQEQFVNEFNSLNSDARTLQRDKFYEVFGRNHLPEEIA